MNFTKMKLIDIQMFNFYRFIPVLYKTVEIRTPKEIFNYES